MLVTTLLGTLGLLGHLTLSSSTSRSISYNIHLSYLQGVLDNYAVLITAGLIFLPIGISSSSGQGYGLQGLVKIYEPVQGLPPGTGGGHFCCFV